MNPIVGVGELLWDVYPDGRKVAGGAPFNFAFHCHQLGHPAAIVSRVGADDLGRELRERVRELGLSDEYIQTDRAHPTGTVRVALGAGAVPTYAIAADVAWDHLAWDEALEPLARSARAVCFGTLAQRRGTPVPLVRLATALHDRRPRGLVVFDVNLRGAFYTEPVLEWGFGVSDWRKVNADELDVLGAVFGWESLAALVDSAKVPECGVAILTRGERGCDVFRRWKQEGEAGAPPRAFPPLAADDGAGAGCFLYESFHEPGVPAKVADTVGAGDAFTAAMVCLHLEGHALRACARFAVRYAARVCEQPGGTPRVDRADVEREAGLRP
jgi:fructokinase